MDHRGVSRPSFLFLLLLDGSSFNESCPPAPCRSIPNQPTRESRSLTRISPCTPSRETHHRPPHPPPPLQQMEEGQNRHQQRQRAFIVRLRRVKVNWRIRRGWKRAGRGRCGSRRAIRKAVSPPFFFFLGLPVGDFLFFSLPSPSCPSSTGNHPPTGRSLPGDHMPRN